MEMLKNFLNSSVKVREELVAFRASELVVTEKGVENGGVHLKPEQIHQLIAERATKLYFRWQKFL